MDIDYVRASEGMAYSVGDIIFDSILLLIGLGFAALIVVCLVNEWRERKLLEAARNMEIGEGVTLLQGIRAYFDEDGFWSAGRETVCILVGTYGHPQAGLRVDPRSGRVEVYNFRRDPSPEGKDEPEALIGTLIQAVKQW